MCLERVANGHETHQSTKEAATPASTDFYREIRTVGLALGVGTTQQICFMLRKRLRLRAKAVITQALKEAITINWAGVA